MRMPMRAEAARVKSPWVRRELQNRLRFQPVRRMPSRIARSAEPRYHKMSMRA